MEKKKRADQDPVDSIQDTNKHHFTKRAGTKVSHKTEDDLGRDDMIARRTNQRPRDEI